MLEPAIGRGCHHVRRAVWAWWFWGQRQIRGVGPGANERPCLGSAGTLLVIFCCGVLQAKSPGNLCRDFQEWTITRESLSPARPRWWRPEARMPSNPYSTIRLGLRDQPTSSCSISSATIWSTPWITKLKKLSAIGSIPKVHLWARMSRTSFNSEAGKGLATADDLI